MFVNWSETKNRNNEIKFQAESWLQSRPFINKECYDKKSTLISTSIFLGKTVCSSVESVFKWFSKLLAIRCLMFQCFPKVVINSKRFKIKPIINKQFHVLKYQKVIKNKNSATRRELKKCWINARKADLFGPKLIKRK